MKVIQAIKHPRARVLAVLLLSGCAMQPMVPPKLDLPPRQAATGTEQAEAVARGEGVTIAKNPPAPAAPAKAAPATSATAAEPQTANIVLNFESLPLPAFIQSVYAIALKRTVSIDPAVEARKDLVTLHSGKPLTAAEAESSARVLLKTYGIAVVDVGGLTRIVPDSANTAYMAEIRRGNALPDSPLPLRPVFQLVELQAVRNTDIEGYLQTLFGSKVTRVPDGSRNAILLGGNGDDVQAAMEAIRILDQPLFKGRDSIRITPLLMSADDMAKRLTEILTQEGYSVGTAIPGGVGYPITLLPIPGVNTVIVFAQSKDIVKHIVDWANVLDKPVEKSVGRSYFSYTVKNTDASRLQETVQQLLQSAPARTATPGAPAVTTPLSTNVVVDKGTNTLIFRASGDDYNDVIRLLHELDRPARQALIEVTVAEVTVGDTINTGVDWIFSRLNKSGLNVTGLGGNTSGVTGTGVPSLGTTTTTGSGSDAKTTTGNFSGFIVSQFDGLGNPRVILNALASDDKATVLSSPKLIARSGETANFVVGSEVPVTTGVQSNASTGGGTLTSVQYRSTGVILKIKPVIHSSDQVDLEVNTEVSSVLDKATAVGSSPSFSKRAVDTKLTLRHGSTYILGGLVSADSSKTDTGIPFLKDIPVVGRAFGSNADSKHRTEMVVLITPYIVSDDGEARAVTDAFRKQLGAWAEDIKPAGKPQ